MKWVLHVLQTSKIGASPSGGLMSYPGHLLGKSYLSAEMQSVYSTDPGNWAHFCRVRIVKLISFFLLFPHIAVREKDCSFGFKFRIALLLNWQPIKGRVQLFHPWGKNRFRSFPKTMVMWTETNFSTVANIHNYRNRVYGVHYGIIKNSM